VPLMFSLPSTVRIFVYSQPTDMRKSFDGLAAIVGNAFSKALFAADDFVFLIDLWIDARFCCGIAMDSSFGPNV
jgi:hypothetical protein